MSKEISLGISTRTFIAGLIIAILASSLLSTVVAMTVIQGPKGDKGDTGTQGTDGTDGIDGIDGKSAYQIWLDQGNSGTEQDFIDSLKGEQGPAGVFTIENMSGWLPAPAYDSGWRDVPSYGQWHTFKHNLNTTEVLVYYIRNNSQEFITHFAYGDWMHWSKLTENEIAIRVDWLGGPLTYDKIRVMIWKIAEEQ